MSPVKKWLNPSKLISFSLLAILFALTSCSENQSVVNNIDEREANEIVVYLATKGIHAQKMKAPTTETAAAGTTQTYWNILVDPKDMVQSMALLNQAGFPRRQGTTLLQLFAKQGLMTTDREENIRYQAGVEEELSNTIRKIDGVLDAVVQISYPSSQEELIPGEEQRAMKAAVYVKHQGIFDDPNNHLVTKIKRLVAGSVDNLDFENVSVVTDRSRFTDLTISPDKETISMGSPTSEYVSVWSIIMTKNSAGKFKTLFSLLIIAILLFGGALGYLIYRFYPMILKIKKAPVKETSAKTTEEGPK